MKKAMQKNAISIPCNSPACANTIVTPAEENVDTLSSKNVRSSNEGSTFYCTFANISERMTGRQHMTTTSTQLTNCIDCAGAIIYTHPVTSKISAYADFGR